MYSIKDKTVIRTEEYVYGMTLNNNKIYYYGFHESSEGKMFRYDILSYNLNDKSIEFILSYGQYSDCLEFPIYVIDDYIYFCLTGGEGVDSIMYRTDLNSTDKEIECIADFLVAGN